MKKKITICLLTVMTGVAAAVFPVSAEKINSREPVAIQKGNFREELKQKTADEHPYHEEKLKKKEAELPVFCKDLEAFLKEAVPAENPPELDEMTAHYPVTLFYEDDTKESYCFFHIDDIWYMKTPQNTVYRDADFIEKDFGSTDSSGSGRTETVLLMDDGFLEILSLAKEFDTLDERYYFSVQANYSLPIYGNREEACAGVREKMLSNRKIYQYAIQNGMEMPAKKLAEKRANSIESRKNASNYREWVQALQDAGLTEKELDKKSGREYNLIQDTALWVQQIKYTEFQHGNNCVDDTVCRNREDYWYHFLTEEVYPEAETYDLSEYEKKLDEAQQYYLEHSRSFPPS